jgi:hypothetical protein
MMSVLSERLYVLIVYVCRKGSSESPSWPVNEDKHKGDVDSQTPVSFVHKGDKIYSSTDSIYTGLPLSRIGGPPFG